MKKAVIAVALSVLVALLSANLDTVAHAQVDLVAPSNVAAENTGNPGEVRISWGTRCPTRLTTVSAGWPIPTSRR